MKPYMVSLISGGVDSAVLLWKYPGTIALTFDYGQTHKKEVEYAKRMCKRARVEEHIILDISDVFRKFSSALLHSKEIMNTKSTIVPNRNMIFMSIAAGLANSRDIHQISYGAHRTDAGSFPDCRLDFVDSIQTTIMLALDDLNFQVKAPFINLEKSDILQIGYKLGAPIHDTWSCYRGGEIHCGTCPACIERKKAFHKAGIVDETEYVS